MELGFDTLSVPWPAEKMDKIGGDMEEYSMWVDATERIVSFHEIANSDLLHFDHREAYLSYLSALTEQGYRFR